jgi:hypothetical protein
MKLVQYIGPFLLHQPDIHWKAWGKLGLTHIRFDTLNSHMGMTPPYQLPNTFFTTSSIRISQCFMVVQILLCDILQPSKLIQGIMLHFFFEVCLFQISSGTPTSLNEIFCSFHQSLKANTGIVA